MLVKPDLLDTLRSEGVELKKKGRDYWACCPFPEHTEKTPSFKVSDRGFYCFGCNTRGSDSIDLVRKIHGFSFVEACSYLGIKDKRPGPGRKEAERRKSRDDAFHEWERKRVNAIAELLRLYRQTISQKLSEEELYILTPLILIIDEIEYEYETFWCSKATEDLKRQIFNEEEKNGISTGRVGIDEV